VRSAVHRPGFNCVELAIVVAIVVVVIGMLIPAAHKVREAAGRAHCQNNLKRLALAAQRLNDVHKRLPPVSQPFNRRRGSVQYHLLPFLDEEELYKRSNDSHDPEVRARRVEVFLCRADASGQYSPSFARGNYAANFRVFRNRPGGSASIPRTVGEGTANTVLFAERYGSCRRVFEACGKEVTLAGGGAWARRTQMTGSWFASARPFQVRPDPLEGCDPMVPSSPHAGGINAAMADGTVRFVSEDTSSAAWRRALSPGHVAVEPVDEIE
jgi:prepilin-type processing-associated H-X9-DG protein